jgi:tetratricopeptide (TPR) repeat protein
VERSPAWLSEQVLRAAADPVVFARGRDYADEGLVEFSEVGADHVSATVYGSLPYEVDLTEEDGALTWACTCPYAEDGSFCKHLVAAGLAAANERGRSGPLEPAAAGTVTDAELRSWLSGHQVGDLVTLLMHAAGRHVELRRELELRVAAERGLAPDFRGYDADLAAAFDTGGFVGWRDMYDWVAEVDAAIDRVFELLEAGFAEAAVSLVERAFAYLEDAYGHVDDSAGQLVDIAERLVEVHLTAVASADVDRAEVAERLLELALASELDTLRDRLGDYRRPLGPEGWQALQRAARDAWSTVPPRSPGDDEPDRFGRRLRLVQVMESLAGDDLEALLAIRSRSLAHPYDWVRIVELCGQAGRDDLAVDWGERGLTAFGEDTDPRLADVLSDAYVRTGRADDAVALERRAFTRAPSTGRYARLRRVAEHTGSWVAERAEAYRVVRAHVAAEERAVTAAQRRNAWWQPPGSLLVALLLEDGEVEQGWDEAVAHGCSEALWLRLAERRAEEHPDDAIEVYRRHLDRVLEPARNDAYDEVVSVLTALAPLYDRAGRHGELRDLIEQIRTGYKRRRNLMARLDRAGLG